LHHAGKAPAHGVVGIFIEAEYRVTRSVDLVLSEGRNACRETAYACPITSLPWRSANSVTAGLKRSRNYLR
jgi:hypothetical protein